MPQLQLPNILALKDIDDLTDVLIQAQFSDFKRLMRQDQQTTNYRQMPQSLIERLQKRKQEEGKAEKARNNINGDGDDDDDDSDYGG